MLLHHREPDCGLPCNGPERRLGNSGEEIEQRCFARPVPAQYAPTFTFRDRERDAGKERCRPESDADVGCRDLGQLSSLSGWLGLCGETKLTRRKGNT